MSVYKVIKEFLAVEKSMLVDTASFNLIFFLIYNFLQNNKKLDLSEIIEMSNQNSDIYQLLKFQNKLSKIKNILNLFYIENKFNEKEKQIVKELSLIYIENTKIILLQQIKKYNFLNNTFNSLQKTDNKSFINLTLTLIKEYTINFNLYNEYLLFIIIYNQYSTYLNKYISKIINLNDLYNNLFIKEMPQVTPVVSVIYFLSRLPRYRILFGEMQKQITPLLLNKEEINNKEDEINKEEDGNNKKEINLQQQLDEMLLFFEEKLRFFDNQWKEYPFDCIENNFKIFVRNFKLLNNCSNSYCLYNNNNILYKNGKVLPKILATSFPIEFHFTIKKKLMLFNYNKIDKIEKNGLFILLENFIVLNKNTNNLQFSLYAGKYELLDENESYKQLNVTFKNVKILGFTKILQESKKFKYTLQLFSNKNTIIFIKENKTFKIIFNSTNKCIRVWNLIVKQRELEMRNICKELFKNGIIPQQLCDISFNL
ncbi:hypothetical protein ABK040_001648 [Willaertia magna]